MEAHALRHQQLHLELSAMCHSIWSREKAITPNEVNTSGPPLPNCWRRHQGIATNH